VRRVQSAVESVGVGSAVGEIFPLFSRSEAWRGVAWRLIRASSLSPGVVCCLLRHGKCFLSMIPQLN